MKRRSNVAALPRSRVNASRIVFGKQRDAWVDIYVFPEPRTNVSEAELDDLSYRVDVITFHRTGNWLCGCGDCTGVPGWTETEVLDLYEQRKKSE